ncbi:MAG: hypothetical protein PHI86_05875 [Candidatus Omnitrophica bacterium]|nr:hypothetical protein [Candidatus Omnitrophota bacterium]
MSLERFSKQNPEISGELGITQLADELIYYCRESLLEKGKNYPATPTLDDAKEYRGNTVNEHAGVWVGNLFIEIEQSMEKGEFDLAGFIDKAKQNLSGTLLNTENFTLPNKYPDLVEIDHDHLTRMRATRNEDKTLTRFLTEEGVLPFEVEDYLTNELGLLDSAPLRYVLRVWESRASRELNNKTTALQKTEDTSMLHKPLRKPASGSESSPTGLSKAEKDRLIAVFKKRKVEEGWTWKEDPQDN